ncbi:hypothetical protein LH496_27760, partial [Klebsiella pneumoniae]|nr:hypothetical protein [Klebsiella pneumoniae]
AEKHRINQFLLDWLSDCLEHGTMAIPFC